MANHACLAIMCPTGATEGCTLRGKNEFIAYSPEDCYTWDSDCSDDNSQCPYWAAIGECVENPSYMLANCKQSCGQCQTPVLDLCGHTCHEVVFEMGISCSSTWEEKCPGVQSPAGFAMESTGYQLCPDECSQMPRDGPYVLGLPGSSTCPAGYTYIIDLETCKTVGSRLGGKDYVIPRRPWWSQWLYWLFDQSKHMCVHFNVDNTDPSRLSSLPDTFSKYVCRAQPGMSAKAVENTPTTLESSLKSKGNPDPFQHYRKIGKHPVLISHDDGHRPIVIFYHGAEQNCHQCEHTLQAALGNAGYTVVSPCDGRNPVFPLGMFQAGGWGKDVARAVLAWAGGRRVGVVGYSYGGGAAIAVSHLGLWHAGIQVPIVAAHPAAGLAGVGLKRGPILYTTGTRENEFMAMLRYVFFTSAWSTEMNYWEAWGPKKAFLKFNGHDHSAPCWQQPQINAYIKWLDCHLKGISATCHTFRASVCDGHVAKCSVKGM